MQKNNSRVHVRIPTPPEVSTRCGGHFSVVVYMSIVLNVGCLCAEKRVVSGSWVVRFKALKVLAIEPNEIGH